MSVPDRPEGVLLDKAATVPPSTLDALAAPKGTILVIAPHPDDETLGCGAAIAAALEWGRDVTIALMTDGDASHPASALYPPVRLAALRRSEFAAAVTHLRPHGAPGTLRTATFGLPDTRLAEAAADEAVLTRLCDLAERTECTTLWTTWRHDPHCDHQAAARIADQVAERMGASLRTFLEYAVWGRFGDAAADLRADDIRRFPPGQWRARKLEAMDCYRSQLTPLIDDDPSGFVMPPTLVDHFADCDEIFIASAGGAQG
ncbi:PIG-L deacetylase family protein [Acuticoccus yangtzensis]|uniref:PIG-L deacetylase family protein n=1 Tax=Acuticoccus yangtzensis TaxID=1443441 RepID=UPI000AC4E72F|nr:PIG-L family deacetylase [Acuticoccus yangtzensis]